jgi:hypothetical protein
MAETLTDDVILIQPLSYPMEGLAAAQDEFRLCLSGSRIFAVRPPIGGRGRHPLHRAHLDWNAGSQHQTSVAHGGSNCSGRGQSLQTHRVLRHRPADLDSHKDTQRLVVLVALRDRSTLEALDLNTEPKCDAFCNRPQ